MPFPGQSLIQSCVIVFQYWFFGIACFFVYVFAGVRCLVHMDMLLLNILKQATSPVKVIYGASVWFSTKSLLAGELWKQTALQRSRSFYIG
jgi:hypothetical protein